MHVGAAGGAAGAGRYGGSGGTPGGSGGGCGDGGGGGRGGAMLSNLRNPEPGDDSRSGARAWGAPHPPDEPGPPRQ